MSQGDRHASVRAATGTALDYNGDWHALFTQAGIPAGDLNGRMLAWINARLGKSYPDLNGAKAAYAASQGVATWDSLGTFSIASYAAETTALLARMTVQPSAARAQVIDNLIGSLKSAGVWAKLDCLYVLAAHDAQAGRLNFKGSSFTLTGVNSPTFTTDRGYAGDGSTSLLDSGFNPSTAGGAFALNSAHLGVWMQQDTAASGVFPFGNLAATIAPNQATGTQQVRLNASATATTGAVTSGLKHYALNRNNSATIDSWIGGAKAISAFAQTSSAMSSLTMTVCGRQTAAGTYQYDSRRIAAAHWGSALADADVSALYNALSAYMTAVGA